MVGYVEKLCIDALNGFYSEGKTGFIEAFDENILWYGPVDGQVIKGRKPVEKYLVQLHKKFRFSANNATATLIPLKADACTIIIELDLLSYKENGKVFNYKQHFIVDLCRRKDENGKYQWKVPLIHISNSVHKKAKSNKIYNHDYSKHISDYVAYKQKIPKLSFVTDEGLTVFISVDEIIYFEGGKGVKCIVHTKGNAFTVNHLLKDMEGKLPESFYRCHSSYILNMDYIKSINNYKIILQNNDTLPIPAKKYSNVKNHILGYFKEKG